MTKQEPWFIEERAFWFASLVLTETGDVKVRAHAGEDMAVDLLAEVLKGGKSTLRFFGVQIVAYLDLPSIPNADERVLGHFAGNPFEAQLPVCTFAIGVRKPEGIYRWVVEPVVEDGRARLDRRVRSKQDAETNWHTLDRAGAARLIAQVNDYYDALQGDLTPKRRDRPAVR
jgi:hypothetical protein